jgi:hypothetical protein
MSSLTNKIIRYSLAIFTVIFLRTAAYAQVDLYANTGVAAYQQRELKMYQDDIIKAIGVPAKATDNFPPYLTYNLGVNLNLRNFIIGIEVGHGSTGGRVYYEDYSGLFKADQLFKYDYIGISTAYTLLHLKTFHLSGGFKLSYNLQS